MILVGHGESEFNVVFNVTNGDPGIFAAVQLYRSTIHVSELREIGESNGTIS